MEDLLIFPWSNQRWWNIFPAILKGFEECIILSKKNKFEQNQIIQILDGLTKA